jgi:predicted acetyltransferase
MLEIDKDTLLSDGVLDLKVVFLYDGKGDMGSVPMYGCFLYLAGTTTRVGEIFLRLGSDREEEICYNGNIGYSINQQYRGKGFALRACELVKRIAIIEGVKELIINCNVRNNSSIKVIEKLGAELIEEIQVPLLYLDEHDHVPKRLRYRWKLST